jgi:hypothetical protein
MRDRVERFPSLKHLKQQLEISNRVLARSLEIFNAAAIDGADGE